MNYEIIKDEQVLKNFIEWLPELQEGETYYVCLFARSKYTTGLVHIKSDKAQLKRFTSKKEDLFNKIRQLECPVGSYTQKGVPIPQEALALYITVNPRNLVAATFSSLTALAKCIQNQSKHTNPHQEVMSEIQRRKARTVYVDFDFDEKPPLEELKKSISQRVNLDAVQILETRGGYHVLISPNKAENKFSKTWYVGIKAISGVDQSGDQMLPVPGCTQGNFIPKFV